MSKNVNMRIEGKKCPAGQESSDQGGPDAGPPQGFGVQGFWGAEGTDEYSLIGTPQVVTR